MPPASSPYLDLPTFLREQRRERYRAVVVHGPPLAGKSAFARRLAELAGGVYVDVLAHVAASPELSAAVDTLDAAFLKRLVLETAAGREPGVPVIVDDFDFLVPPWGGDLAPFLEMARRLSDTETPVTPVFFLQTRPALEEARLLTSGGRGRVLRFEELQALP